MILHMHMYFGMRYARIMIKKSKNKNCTFERENTDFDLEYKKSLWPGIFFFLIA